MDNCVHTLHRHARAVGSSLCALFLLLGVMNTAGAQIINTVAGTTNIAGRPARSISVSPMGMATAPDGTVYVADNMRSQVFRFDPIAQAFTLVAGSMTIGSAGDGGVATSAQLNYPTAVAVDVVGNLFIADLGNGRIRKVDATSGIISTVAGGGSNTDDGVLATEALLFGPRSVAIGSDGSIYIVDQDAARIRRVDPVTGFIFTIAGSGAYGSSGDDGPAISAQLARPTDVVLDALGNLYIADQNNHCVRVIDATTGIIRRFAGTGQQASSVVDGNPAIETPLSSPAALRFDAQGNLLITELDTGRIRKIDAATTIVSTVAGGGSEFDGVPAISGRIDAPEGIALAPNGDLYVSSQSTYTIQRISGATGMLALVAGNMSFNSSGDGQSALLAQMWPMSSVVNVSGDLFVLDSSRIRKVNASTGIISTYAGAGSAGVPGEGGPAIDAFLSFPTAMTIDAGGNLFVSDTGNHRIRKINAASGIISHYAGNGVGSSGDGGPAINAKMQDISDMATDAAGNLYVAEDGSWRIRKINAATGIITTIAGNGTFSGPWGDGQLATNISLFHLEAMALDRQGNIFIAQSSRIRRISAATGIISTVAGTGDNLEYGDGGPALSAGLMINDFKLDAAGNIFIASSATHRVRRIDAVTKIITTVVGTGIAGYSGDGGPATGASLYAPRDLALNSAGDLYITQMYRVRRVSGIGVAAPPGDTTAPIINASVSGTQGNNGWYKSNVTVKWTVSDPESNITSTSGCTTATISTDTTGLNLTCTAISNGGMATKTVTVKRDTSAPSMTFGTPIPAPNAAGWINTDASIPYTVSDTVSGVLGSTQGTTQEWVEGINLKYTMSPADKAGNSSAITLPYLKIDKTAPAAVVTTPANTATYVTGSAVFASYSCSDALSGISSCIGSVPNGAAIDTSTPGNKTFSVTVTDRAGNVTTTISNYNVGSIYVPAYCSSRGSVTTYDAIRSVQVGSWINTSYDNGGYGDFTANPRSVVRGENAITLTPNDGYTDSWRVWIDLNVDGVFSADEILYSGTSSAQQTGTLNIPSTAVSGPTRMRVSMSFAFPPNACGTFDKGEVEDYTVLIP